MFSHIFDGEFTFFPMNFWWFFSAKLPMAPRCARLVLPRELCPGGGEGRASRHGDLGCFFGAAGIPIAGWFLYLENLENPPKWWWILGVAPKNRKPPYILYHMHNYTCNIITRINKVVCICNLFC